MIESGSTSDPPPRSFDANTNDGLVPTGRPSLSAPDSSSTALEQAGPLVGLVRLGHVEPVPGMASHPASYPYPVLTATLTGESLVARAVACDDSLLEEIVDQAEHLIAAGALAIVTTVGYFIGFQSALAARLSVPVFTSSLLLCRLATAVAGQGRVLVVMAVAENGRGTGVPTPKLSFSHDTGIIVQGMQDGPLFSKMVLQGAGIDDADGLRREVTDAIVSAVEQHGDVSAIVIECADLSFASAEVRQRTGLAVFDYLGLVELARASVATPMPPAHTPARRSRKSSPG